MNKPLIGITPAFYHHEELDRSIIAANYTDRVQHAGGVPVIIPPLHSQDQINGLLDKLDAVILGGGRDVQPQRYQGQLIPEIPRPQLPQRDHSDFLLVEALWERCFPTLGICLGLQELNVFLGGDLYQHIPNEVSSNVTHRIGEMFDARHAVRVAEGSTLEQVLGARRVETNSAHHQAIKTLADDLIAVAWSDDGLIEAAEPRDKQRPLLAVQWHPEMDEPEQVGLDLFRWLVQQIL